MLFAQLFFDNPAQTLMLQELLASHSADEKALLLVCLLLTTTLPFQTSSLHEYCGLLCATHLQCVGQTRTAPYLCHHVFTALQYTAPLCASQCRQ
jgi:hypothetical protein